MISRSRPSQAQLIATAKFPPRYFLESLAVRKDNSLLISAMNHRELWYVPPWNGTDLSDPLLLYTFPQLTMGITEGSDDVFYLLLSNIYSSHESHLLRINLVDWKPGFPIAPEPVLTFPTTVRGLNGCCMLAADVLLAADCFGSRIWRVDLAADGCEGEASVWAHHESMAHLPDGPMPDQPGVNGIKYSAKTGHIYYTSTAQRLFMRVAVEPGAWAVAGEPEVVATGMMGDDFWIDEERELAYVTTHRQNTVDLVSLDPTRNDGGSRTSVAGDPFTDMLIGPTNGCWGRLPGESGRVAYGLTDGGTKTAPLDGIAREAAVVRMDFGT
jgi:hypothetical protein